MLMMKMKKLLLGLSLFQWYVCVWYYFVVVINGMWMTGDSVRGGMSLTDDDVDLKKNENKLWRWLSRLTVRADNRVLFFNVNKNCLFVFCCVVGVLFVVCRVVHQITIRCAAGQTRKGRHKLCLLLKLTCEKVTADTMKNYPKSRRRRIRGEMLSICCLMSDEDHTVMCQITLWSLCDSNRWGKHLEIWKRLWSVIFNRLNVPIHYFVGLS